MKPENKQFLDDNLDQFRIVERAQYIRGLSGSVRENFQRIMGEEFSPGYQADLWCPSCCFDMVKLVYTRYYNWLKDNYNDGTEHIDMTNGIEKMNVVFSSPAVIVKATFPAHQKKKKQ